jgi:hypothetical protein
MYFGSLSYKHSTGKKFKSRSFFEKKFSRSMMETQLIVKLGSHHIDQNLSQTSTMG